MERKKILIVDDEPEIREILKEALERKCDVITAGNAEEALRAFLDFKPNAVLMDVQLGGLVRGDHILLLLRMAFPDIPVFMMSGAWEYKETLLSRGASHFFPKPFEMYDLYNVLIENGVIHSSGRS